MSDRLTRVATAILWTAAFVLGPPFARCAPVGIRDVTLSSGNAFSNALYKGMGLSFRYGVSRVGPEIPSGWIRVTREKTETGVERISWTHQSGLQVSQEIRIHSPSNAIEYRTYFKNVSKKALPPISEIRSLDLTFSKEVFDGICVISSGGGMAEAVFPPESFSIKRRCFEKALKGEDGWSIVLTTEGGRSSNKDLPFFFIQNESLKAGIFVAYGWSGQWEATVSRNHTDHTLHVIGKIPDLEIALEPGEEIGGPTILLGFYQGEDYDGSNQLRRLLTSSFVPRLSGRQFSPLATFNSLYGNWETGIDYNESTLKRQIDVAANTGQEVYLLDAGWYAGSGHKFDFSSGLGNWYQIDSRKLPNGLGPIANYAQAKGLRFGMWFEPERVTRGSKLSQEHPDWVLWKHEKYNIPFFSEWNAQDGLLDYGRPEVQLWVEKMIDYYINRYGIGYIRYDFNIDPLAWWNAQDGTNRRGITQLRHVNGFYAVIDWLRRHHPDVILEGCASGGRRIDLETVRRFHTFWINDYSVDPTIVRYQLLGISRFLPGNSYIQYTPPPMNGDLGFQSLFAGALGLGGAPDAWPSELQREASIHVRAWKKIRPFLVKDYYPLSDQPQNLRSWTGWQFHDPQRQAGFIQVFRDHDVEPQRQFLLHGLRESAHYRFADLYNPAEGFETSGKEAMIQGIHFTMDPMSSRALMYEIVRP